VAKLRIELGNQFTYDAMKNVLIDDTKQSMNEILTQAREIKIIRTKRNKNDMRKVFILINEKKLLKELERAEKRIDRKLKSVRTLNGRLQIRMDEITSLHMKLKESLNQSSSDKEMKK
jgi:hypothetical protein